MSRYFLGADVGSTKTHILITDEQGKPQGFGEAGPGNHESVGYEGLATALKTATDMALASAGLTKKQIAAAGFGVAGFDWPSEKPDTLRVIQTLGLPGPIEAVNDTMLGLMAGSESGWGIGVVSGTGCNCRGWDKLHQMEGMVTGAGRWMGEAAGATELVGKAVIALSHEWSRRGPATQLTPTLVQFVGAKDLPDLLEGIINNRYRLRASAAPLIFQVAAAGDAVAQELIHWAGCELGELVNAVIRQLHFQSLEFDIVMLGSMFNGGAPLIDPMKTIIWSVAPGARFTRLAAPPVVGAVLLAMDIAAARTPQAFQQLRSFQLETK